MKALSNFFINYKRSLRDFTFYKESLQKPVFFSLQFLYLLTFIVIFINTVLIAISAAFFLPTLPSHITTLQKRLRILYPQDLVITIKDGVISTNKKEPIYLDIPEMRSTTPYEHFITIHTQADAFDYRDLNTMLLVTRSGVVYPEINDGTASYRVEDARSFGDARIDRSVYNSALTRFNTFLNILPVMAPWLLISGVIFIPLFGSLIVSIWRLVVLLILTSIILPISLLFGNKYTYRQLYKMGLYGLAVPISLTFVLNMFGVFIPVVFASSFLLWMVIVLSQIGNREATTE